MTDKERIENIMNDTHKEVEKSPKKIKAKSTSLIAQILASFWVAFWSAKKFLTNENIEVTDIIYSGFAIASCFSPVYFSLILDKIKNIKFGD